MGGNGQFQSNAAHDFAKLKQSLENKNNKGDVGEHSSESKE